MKESVIYQDWFQQGFKEGFQKGLVIEVLGQLKRLIGEIESEDEIRISALSIEQYVSPEIVVGFHGCERSIADKVIKQGEPLADSQNDYD